ncbi:MAG: helix-turn-helix transcriptional regulator [Bacteroidota bacterium]
MEKEEFNRKLGSFICRKRLEKKWTQQMLADKVGNNFQNISRIERGKLSPTLFWCSKLAEVFEMDMHTFIEEAFR